VIDPTQQSTRILNDWSAGAPSALDRLTPIVYADLHRIAERKLFHDRNPDLLQPSAPVNDAFVRLLACSRVEWQDRAHFFARSARIMRHVLVNFTRKHRIPRGDLSSMSALLAGDQFPTDLLDVDAALNELAELHARQAQVLEMRYYAGLSIAKAAAVLGTSHASVNREWQTARAWSFKQLRPGHGTR
jgi:RNA polymerase sigma factor (TIGR02999 family)